MPSDEQQPARATVDAHSPAAGAVPAANVDDALHSGALAALLRFGILQAHTLANSSSSKSNLPVAENVDADVAGGFDCV